MGMGGEKEGGHGPSRHRRRDWEVLETREQREEAARTQTGMLPAPTLQPRGSGRKTRQEDGALARAMGGEEPEDPGRYLEVGTSHPPGAGQSVVHPPQDAGEQRWSRRAKPLPPLWVGTRPPPPPSPRHIPSVTATKRSPRDPPELPYLTPGGGGLAGERGGGAQGVPEYHPYHPRAASPTPAPGSAGGGSAPG